MSLITRPAFRMSLAVVASIALLSTTALGQFPLPELKTITPPGGKAGSTVDVKITGVNFDDAEKMIFSHAGITATPKMSEPDSLYPEAKPLVGEFTITIKGDVPSGVYEARIIGRYGVSNPRAFAVDRVEEQTDKDSTATILEAPIVTIPTIINGSVAAGNRDHFKLSLKKGQRIIADCMAERIDSRMDGALVIYSAGGNELARNRDSVGADPVIDFTAPDDGDYVIGLYDFVYGGGAEHFYRLKIHSGPQIDFIFPPSIQPGASGQFTVFGRNLPQGKPSTQFPDSNVEEQTVTIAAPKDAPSASTAGATFVTPLHMATQPTFVYRISQGDVQSNAAPLFLASQPIVTEAEPNDSSETAQKVTAPCEYVGRFYPARDLDWVEFEAQAGETWWIEVVSHRMGLSADPFIIVERVTEKDGVFTSTKVASADDPASRNNGIGTDYDATTDDPVYKLDVKEAGTYRVAVRDQFGDGRSDPSYVYRLIIRRPEPDFRLITKAPERRPVNNNVVAQSSLSIRKGGAVSLPIEIERRDGFDGEVELTAEGLPAGVSCPPVVVNGSVNNASLIFTAAENAAAAAVTIKVRGAASINNQQVIRQANSAVLMRSSTNRTNDPPQFRTAQDFVLAVVDQETAPVTVTVGDGTMLETSKGGTLDIPVKVARRDNGKVALKLTAIGLPNEVKPGDVSIAADKTDGVLKMAITNNNAKPGLYSFVLRGDLKFKYAQNPEAVAVAEAEQKRLDELVKKFDTANKQADAAKKTAAAELQKLQAAAKSAATAKATAEAVATKAKQAADKAAEDAKAEAQKQADEAQAKLVEATAKLEEANKLQQQAEAKKNETEAAATAAAAELKKAQDAKKKADTDLANIKKAAAPKDITYWQFSTPVSVRIEESPFTINETQPVTLKQAGTAETNVVIAKKYAFDDKVDVTISPDKAASGVSIKPVSIPKGQNQAKFEIVANEKTPPGEYEFAIQAKGKFNNVNVAANSTIKVTIQPK